MKRQNQTNSNVRLILNLALEPKLWFVVIIPLLTIILGQKGIIISWLSAQIFNKLQFVVEGNRDLSLLKSAVFFCVLLFLVNIAEWLISTISDLIENYWREYVNNKLQQKFIEKDYKINAANFDNPDFISRRSVAQSVDPIGQIKEVVICISKFLATVSFSIVMWNYSPIFILIAIIIRLPIYFFINNLNDRNREFTIATNVTKREMNYYKNIPIDRGAVKEFKIFNMKDFVCNKYDLTFQRYHKEFKNKYKKNAVSDLLVTHYEKIGE